MTLELSIPDALAQAAHRAAAGLGISSSELFARAVVSFLRSASEVVRTERSPVAENRDPVWTDGLAPRRG
jgi:hypothetical protein